MRYDALSYSSFVDSLLTLHYHTSLPAPQFMQTLIADFGTNHYYAADGTFSHAAAPWASLGEALADPVNGIRKQYREARDA